MKRSAVALWCLVAGCATAVPGAKPTGRVGCAESEVLIIRDGAVECAGGLYRAWLMLWDLAVWSGGGPW